MTQSEPQSDMKPTDLCIPMAIQVVIDDVGWWSGKNDSAQGGPYRTGMPRDHVPADYAAIVELGKRLGIRPQAAMILCEWDRTNLLRHVPTATWMGRGWDNRRWVGPWLDEAARILHDGREHVALTVHGVGHEYWEHGTFTRAEWFDPEFRMRPEASVRRHMDAYAEIMRHNELGPLPQFMVPCAYKYRFCDPDGFASILAEYGIRFVTTVTPHMLAATNQTMDAEWFGVDEGVLVIEWGAASDKPAAVVPWDAVAPDLSDARTVDGPTLGLHWPNLLHPDPQRNSEVVDRWVTYLQQYEQRLDRMLAPDPVACYTQLLYHWGTDLRLVGKTLHFDFARLDGLGLSCVETEFILKVRRRALSPGQSLETSSNVSLSPASAATDGDPASEYVLYRVRRKG